MIVWVIETYVYGQLKDYTLYGNQEVAKTYLDINEKNYQRHGHVEFKLVRRTARMEIQ